MLLQSFAPIEDEQARMLILGSMPGALSLKMGEYYAHPRNLFWPIMAELCGFDAALPYQQRSDALKSAHIALWDVLHSCKRVGSADAKIDNSSLKINDFARFLREHPQIRHIFFNGAKAESCYRRQVLPLPGFQPIRYLRLPSTSPAYAALNHQQKLAAWRHAFSSV